MQQIQMHRGMDVDTDDDADSGTGASSGVTEDLSGARANSQSFVAAGGRAGSAFGIFGACTGGSGVDVAHRLHSASTGASSGNFAAVGGHSVEGTLGAGGANLSGSHGHEHGGD